MSLWDLYFTDFDKGRSVTAEELRRYIVLSAGEAFPVQLKDARYRLLPWPLFQRLMSAALQPVPPYTAGKFDCDDLATCWEADLRRFWAAKCKNDDALAAGQALLSMKGGTRHVSGWQMDEALTFTLVECYQRSPIPLGRVERIEQATG